MTPKEILKQYFGYDEFRKGQAEISDALLSGQDALGVMPTGAGKSLCYQIPAMLLPGVTLVISPLISLMRDQVLALVANGVPAAFINSSLTDRQWEEAMTRARAGQYKIIYMAPERLLAPSIVELARSIRVSLIAVDEAHCVSQWGQDFRPSYLDIPRFVEELPVRPVLAAFTATATPRVREDILALLKLNDPLTLITGFDRPNLYFENQRPADKYAALVQYLEENDGCGIVYCSTRKEVESVSERLVRDGYAAARYHAGLPGNERSQSQDDFLYDRVRVIVATNAFGMGIDKSNVRFIIHYNMPQNVESYYQEAGRAGRDGLPGSCVLFYARKDIITALYLIKQSENPEEIARNKKLLNLMERYCETDGCLRRYILSYFGETVTEDCGNCGNCNGVQEETDVTQDAQKVLSHITRLNNLGKRLMFAHTADILLGKSVDYTDLPTFGIMKGATRRYIRRITSRLESLGYLHNDVYLSAAPSARDVLINGAKVTIKGGMETAPEKAGKHSQNPKTPQTAFSNKLFAKLKELRLTIARRESVPAFVVFSDATLVDMCQKHPRTKDEMLAVSGVGNVKLERYGEAFLALLSEEEPEAEPLEKPQPFTNALFFEQFETEDNAIQVSQVANNISAVLLRYGKPDISGIKLNKLLLEAGYIEIIDDTKLPTDKGRALGIVTVQRKSQKGTYAQCLYGEAAQRRCGELVINAL